MLCNLQQLFPAHTTRAARVVTVYKTPSRLVLHVFRSLQGMKMWAAALSVVWVSVMAVADGAEVAPTGVAPALLRTQPPAEVVRPQYAQTLYMATDSSTIMNTLVPLWPSHSVEYQSTPTTTVNNQTISTSIAEFATVLNTTVEYYSELMTNNTWDVAATTYQTMDFQHQSVLYTDRQNVSHTEIENNLLPFV